MSFKELFVWLARLLVVISVIAFVVWGLKMNLDKPQVGYSRDDHKINLVKTADGKTLRRGDPGFDDAVRSYNDRP
ncbi:MAG: hypothetical protein MRY49_03250 [Candidatus Pacebacteria bacterium]|nr:hypothetical protein [Candidatus Paceibacterota bacterium]